MPSARLAGAIAAIDAANADDPNTLIVRGVERPKEQAHAELMTEWVTRLDPAASEAQLLAARAHHLRRWVVPRSSYPDGRAGYLRWRTAQKQRHASEVAVILDRVGYRADVIERVQQLVRKEGLARDPQVQTHEDALCLVFVETQLAPVAADLGDDKTVAVVAKTLAKMSPRAVELATELPLEPNARTILERAVRSRP